MERLSKYSGDEKSQFQNGLSNLVWFEHIKYWRCVWLVPLLEFSPYE